MAGLAFDVNVWAAVDAVKEAFEQFGKKALPRAVQYTLNKVTIQAVNDFRTNGMPIGLRHSTAFTRKGVWYELDRSNLDAVTSVDPRKRRSPSSLSARIGMAAALGPVVVRMSTEQVRTALGDSLGNKGQLRRDLCDIKSRDPERLKRLGFERLFWMCDCLGIDPVVAMAGTRAVTLKAVH